MPHNTDERSFQLNVVKIQSTDRRRRYDKKKEEKNNSNLFKFLALTRARSRSFDVR